MLHALSTLAILAIGGFAVSVIYRTVRDSLPAIRRVLEESR